MNRNDEWFGFVDDIRGSVPEQIEYSARQAVLRAKKDRRLFLLVKLPFIGFFMIFILFFTLVNKSSGFVNSLGNIPPLRALVRIMTIRREAA